MPWWWSVFKTDNKHYTHININRDQLKKRTTKDFPTILCTYTFR